LFFFFSNRTGCLGSLLITLLGTLFLLWLMGWIGR
jgi:predicted RND superfamily exporter protein